jgi:four helix bundle protein
MTASNPLTTLPHHKLQAYTLALELVRLVTDISISDAHLRKQARKSAASGALNTAEGAGRRSRADKSRVYGIALGEVCEAAAAVEIAGALGSCRAADVERVLRLAERVKNVLSRLIH